MDGRDPPESLLFWVCGTAQARDGERVCFESQLVKCLIETKGHCCTLEPKGTVCPQPGYRYLALTLTMHCP